MITGWKSFVHAVDQLRQLQKKGVSKNDGELYIRMCRLESEIDLACDKKIAEWNKEENLFANAGYTP